MRIGLARLAGIMLVTVLISVTCSVLVYSELFDDSGSSSNTISSKTVGHQPDADTLLLAVRNYAAHCDTKTNSVDGVPMECRDLHDWRATYLDLPLREFPGAIPQKFIQEALMTQEQILDPKPGEGITRSGERVKPGTADCEPGYHVVGNDEAEGCYPD